MYLLMLPVLLLIGCAQQSPFPTLQDLRATSPIVYYNPAAPKPPVPVLKAVDPFEEGRRWEAKKAQAQALREAEQEARAEELDREEAQRQKEYQAWERDLQRKDAALTARHKARVAEQRAKMTPAQRQREDAENEAVRSVQRLQQKLRAAEACYKLMGRVC